MRYDLIDYQRGAAVEVLKRLARGHRDWIEDRSLSAFALSASTYSAARRNSSSVADMPRLRRTGFPVFPAFFKSSKFCMLRAPIWRQSAYAATRSTCAVSSTSVTTGRPEIG